MELVVELGLMVGERVGIIDPDQRLAQRVRVIARTRLEAERLHCVASLARLDFREQGRRHAAWETDDGPVMRSFVISVRPVDAYEHLPIHRREVGNGGHWDHHVHDLCADLPIVVTKRAICLGARVTSFRRQLHALAAQDAFLRFDKLVLHVPEATATEVHANVFARRRGLRRRAWCRQWRLAHAADKISPDERNEGGTGAATELHRRDGHPYASRMCTKETVKSAEELDRT
mmetsp:Transcript_90334/g.254978  ORF Transcript_90334/g.254978 Transcript_90334/m.254978 type:complete len:232 (+) Transcript_90334:421-1116(+)